MELMKLDSLGKIAFVGSGRVIAKNGKPPVNTMLVGDTPKVYFNVLFSTIKTESGELQFKNRLCATYAKQSNIALYKLCTTLQRNETVEITGYVVRKQGKDANTQEDRIFEEVTIETLVPVSRLHKLLLGMDGTDADKLLLADIVKATPKGTGNGYTINDDDLPF